MNYTLDRNQETLTLEWRETIWLNNLIKPNNVLSNLLTKASALIRSSWMTTQTMSQPQNPPMS